MVSLADCVILKFRPDTLQTVRKSYDLDKPGRIDEAIDILEEWIKKQHHFLCKEFDRGYLERVIIFNKGSIEGAKSRLDKMCTLRTMMPEFFGRCELRFRKNNIFEHAMMPDLTPAGQRIYVIKTCENAVLTPEAFVDFLFDGIVCCEYVMTNDYNTGFIAVADLRTINLLDAISKVDFSLHRRIHTILREGYGFRIKNIHYISGSKVIETLIALLKPSFPEKIAKRVHVHYSHETLYDHLPKELLCKEYGGNAPTLTELHVIWEKAFSSEKHIKHMKKMNQCRTDESKRIGGSLDHDYVPGTFRNLAVD